MWPNKRRAVLCCLGLGLLACGDPVTQPDTSRASTGSSPLLSTEVPGIWRMTPALVPGRADMAAAVIEKSIVVVGGSTSVQDEWQPLTRVDAYNVETKTWTQLKSLPEPRIRHGATTINGRIYVAGGLGLPVILGDPQPKKSLFVYDPETNTWTRKADMPQPVYLSRQANLLGRLYVYAAGTDLSAERFFAYSPATDRWVSLPVPPSRHMDGVMAALGGKLYLTNGNSQTSFNRELDVYDPATRRWTVKSPMLNADGGGVAAVFHGKLWVAGNEDAVSSARDLQVYDPNTDQWRRGPLMLTSSRWGAAAWAGGKFFVIGGYDPEKGGLTSTVQALSTPY